MVAIYYIDNNVNHITEYINTNMHKIITKCNHLICKKFEELSISALTGNDK